MIPFMYLMESLQTTLTEVTVAPSSGKASQWSNNRSVPCVKLQDIVRFLCIKQRNNVFLKDIFEQARMWRKYQHWPDLRFGVNIYTIKHKKTIQLPKIDTILGLSLALCEDILNFCHILQKLIHLNQRKKVNSFRDYRIINENGWILSLTLSCMVSPTADRCLEVIFD